MKQRTSVFSLLAFLMLLGLGLASYWFSNRNITPASETTPCGACATATAPLPTANGTPAEETLTPRPPAATATWEAYPASSPTLSCGAGCEATATEAILPTNTAVPANTATLRPVTRTASATVGCGEGCGATETLAPPENTATYVPIISETPPPPSSPIATPTSHAYPQPCSNNTCTPTSIIIYMTVIVNITPATVMPTISPAPNVTVIFVTQIMPSPVVSPTPGP